MKPNWWSSDLNGNTCNHTKHILHTQLHIYTPAVITEMYLKKYDNFIQNNELVDSLIVRFDFEKKKNSLSSFPFKQTETNVN